MGVDLDLNINKHIEKHDIEEIILSLGYKKTEFDNTYFWFDYDYRSTRGCWFSFGYNREYFIEGQDRQVKTSMETSTKAGRSYYDLQMQIDTIKLLEERFGGTVYGDGEEGYFENDLPKLSRTDIACGFAYINFKRNLAMVEGLIEDVDLERIKNYEENGLPLIFEKNYLRNNTLLPFFVSVMENFLKTFTYRYIETNEEAQNIIYKKKDRQLPYNVVKKLINGEKNIIDIEIEEYSFQNFKSANRAFIKYIGIDLFKDILSHKIPVEGQEKTLVTVLTEMIDYRHKLIHEALLNNTLGKNKMKCYHSSLELLGNVLVSYLLEKRDIRIDLEEEL
ncbi:hypothetical protein [Metabacillus sp. 84]|uniref:hypothetical protein n=1 Tax=Metabacillus sp. 84 TaxID=3404705 RepID=UPI003CF9AD56